MIINGLVCYPIKKRREQSLYQVNGIPFETYEEFLIAELLFKMAIDFRHHLEIKFEDGPDEFGKKQEYLWRPDFVFTQPFRWIGKPCNGSVIIGIEAKRKHIKGKPLKKSRLLCNHYGIPILLLNGDNLESYSQKGALPLMRLAS